MKGPLIGCIADDFTGATDLAGLLARSGMRVVQCFGIPNDPGLVAGYDAVVVALKSRSIPATEACRQSCETARWLRSIGTSRYFFKYCSTFDSTGEGNIGPVAEALMECLQVKQTIFCPAFPENGRTVYLGHLFVGDRLLNESGMQNHPLNPMTDADLVRFLAGQSQSPVGLLSLSTVASGAATIQSTLQQLPPLVIADAVDDSHLDTIAAAVVDHRLVTGGSAIAGCIAKVLVARGEISSQPNEASEPFVSGPAAVLAGSCSLATQEQVRTFAQRHAALQLDVAEAAGGEAVLTKAKHWIKEHAGNGPMLISTTADAVTLEQIRSRVGREQAAQVAENLLSELAAYLVELGVRRLVVAGGETAGAVTQRLGIEAIRIGPEIAPGVPWTESIGQPRLAPRLNRATSVPRSFSNRRSIFSSSQFCQPPHHGNQYANDHLCPRDVHLGTCHR